MSDTTSLSLLKDYSKRMLKLLEELPVCVNYLDNVY